MAVKKLNRLEIQDLLNRYLSELNKLEYQVRQVNATISDLQSSLDKSVVQPVADKPAVTRKRRGRPRKAAAAKTEKAAAATTPKRGRGRPRKSEATTAKPAAKEASKAKAKKATAPTPKRKRGRPRKTNAAVAKPVASSGPKKRGRKPGSKIGKGYRLSNWDTFILDSLNSKGKILVHGEFQEMAKDWTKANNMDADEANIKGKISRSIHKLANKRKDIVKTSFEGRGFAYGLTGWFNPNGELKKKYKK